MEKDIEHYFCEKLKAKHCLVWKFVSPNMAGVPDRIVIMPYGKIVFVELKAEGKKLRPLQEKRFEELRLHFVTPWVVSSKNDVVKFIDFYVERGDL